MCRSLDMTMLISVVLVTILDAFRSYCSATCRYGIWHHRIPMDHLALGTRFKELLQKNARDTLSDKIYFVVFA